MTPAELPPGDEQEAAGHRAELAELRRRVAELEESVAARDELIGLVGHELRNPLSPVFLQAYHLIAEVRKKAEPGDAAVSTDWLIPRLEQFLRGLDRLLDRLNRLMDVAALQSRGSISLVKEDVDLCLVVSDVVASLGREADAAGSRIALSMPTPVMGHWDQVRLEQIAVNLVSNAIRYGGGSAIEVRVAARSPETADLTVSDRGPGIPDELRERLFERLERTGTRPHKGGLGLGLWIVRRLCEVMGGAVMFESRPGEGTIFLVTLPRGTPSDDADR